MRPLSERFWSKISQTETCWIWTAGKSSDGYGRIGLGGKQGRTVNAHVVSWTLHNGSIPTGFIVCHHCDNPSCVRPDHLFLGTHKDNAMDRNSKRRQVHGHRVHCAKLSYNSAERIRLFYGQQKASIAELAYKFDVSPTAIWKVLAGRSWVNGESTS